MSASPPTSEVRYCCAICDTPNAYLHWYPTLKQVPVNTNLLKHVIVSTSSSGQPSSRAVWSPQSMYAFIFSIILAPLCFGRLCSKEFLQEAWLVLRLSCGDVSLKLVTMNEVLITTVGAFLCGLHTTYKRVAECAYAIGRSTHSEVLSYV